DFLGALVIGRETGQPVAKHMVERGVSRSGLLAGLLDQPLFGAEGDVFHRTKIVRTGFVSNRRAREASPCDSEAAASGHGVPKSVSKRPRADWLGRAIWRKSSEIRGSSATRCQKSLAQPAAVFQPSSMSAGRGGVSVSSRGASSPCAPGRQSMGNMS